MTATYPVNRPNRFPLRENNGVNNTWLVLGASGVGYTSIAALQAAGDNPAPGVAPYGVLPGPGFNSAGIQLTVTNDGGGGVAGSAFYIAVNPHVPPATIPIENNTGGSYGPIEGPFYTIWFLKTVGSDRLTFNFAF